MDSDFFSRYNEQVKISKKKFKKFYVKIFFKLNFCFRVKHHNLIQSIKNMDILFVCSLRVLLMLTSSKNTCSDPYTH